MARKVLRATPARDRSREDESLLIRSAESLGRMIGSLQRQLDVATRRSPAHGQLPAPGSRSRRNVVVRGKKRDRSARDSAEEISVIDGRHHISASIDEEREEAVMSRRLLLRPV
jgi:hypothetical protein